MNDNQTDIVLIKKKYDKKIISKSIKIILLLRFVKPHESSKDRRKKYRTCIKLQKFHCELNPQHCTEIRKIYLKKAAMFMSERLKFLIFVVTVSYIR